MKLLTYFSLIIVAAQLIFVKAYVDLVDEADELVVDNPYGRSNADMGRSKFK